MRAQDAQPVGERLGERGRGAGRVPGLAPPTSEVAAGGQGVGMVGAPRQ